MQAWAKPVLVRPNQKKKEKKRKKDICWAKIDPTILGRDRPNPTFLGLTQLGGPT
jgi:hypothetical protein